MAEYYDNCDVDPCLPMNWFTDKDIESLKAQGFEFRVIGTGGSDKKDHYNIYASEGPHAPYGEVGDAITDCPGWDDIFQGILKRENSDI